MNSGDPYNITYQRQRFRNNDRGEEELEDIELGDREYHFGRAKKPWLMMIKQLSRKIDLIPL